MFHRKDSQKTGEAKRLNTFTVVGKKRIIHKHLVFVRDFKVEVRISSKKRIQSPLLPLPRRFLRAEADLSSRLFSVMLFRCVEGCLGYTTVTVLQRMLQLCISPLLSITTLMCLLPVLLLSGNLVRLRFLAIYCLF